ncbi:MAG: N-acetylneuraminate synthase family protein [Candidatus Omnitrophica bacterium]|nr:N-acetylneuraminate synthase family protein [Candidatus Omnitrophota bacterium]
MQIGKFNLDQDILVIAEIGNNHEGDFDRAGQMIHAAAQAGAGAVKFQTIVPEKLVAVSEEKRIQQLERFRFSYDQYAQLARIAEEQGVMFLSTPFDLESVRALTPMVPAFKIASSDNDFYPLLEAVAATGKPLIFSTGLADLEQISKTESFIDGVWRKNKINQEMAILHCVTSYPTKPEDANLRAIQTLREEFGGTVGYSDHTMGIQAALTAVALGARIIEKHFTLDKNLSDFRDHQLSADPEDLKQLVQLVKEVQITLGDGSLNPRQSEMDIVHQVRRSIVAGRDLDAGQQLTPEDISWVRPGGGLAPGSEGQILGKKLTKAVGKGERILAEYLQD